MLNLLSIIVGVLATTVDAAPSRTGRVDTYHLNAWDCSEPLSLHHFSVKECHEKPTDKDLVEVGLVQEKPTYKVRGYKCRVRMTVHRFICGLFSYEKPIMTAGGLDQNYLVDADECKQMIRDKLFRPRPTAKFTLEIPGETFVRDITLGATSVEGGDETCQGTTAVIDGKTISRLVEIRNYQVEVQPENFLATDTAIDATTTGETLPCRPADLGCRGGVHTYIWYRSSQVSCPFALLRTVSGHLQGGQFYAPAEGLLLSVEAEPVAVPVDCEGLEIYRTQIDGVLLSRTIPHLPAANGRQVAPVALFEALSSFVVDLADEVQHQEAVAGGRRLCQKVRESRQGEPVSLGSGVFGQRRGDTWIRYRCVSTRVPVREDEYCYDAVPISHTKFNYMDVETRMLKSTAEISPCMESFPLRIQTEQGWVRITPQILEEQAPPVLHDEVGTYLHHATRPAGLYTRAELKDWETLHVLPSFRSMVIADVAVTGCSQWKDCPLPAVPGAPTPTFLQAAEGQIIDAITPGWWVQFQDGVYYTCLVSGGLFLPYALINAILCFKGWIIPGRRADAGTNLNVALNHGVTAAIEMQPQEASCPPEM